MTRIFALCTLLVPLLGGSAIAQRLEFTSCSSGEQARIRSQLRWIHSNQLELLDQITMRQPDAFIGASKRRLKSFFKQDVTKIMCSRDPIVCGTNAPVYEIDGVKVPFPHQYPLTLCMDYFNEDAALTIALAHQVGHHILINSDKTECIERCRAPNLAVLFSETARNLLNGEPFSMEWCLTACAPPRDDLLLHAPSDAGLAPTLPAPRATDQLPDKQPKPSPNMDR
jgi:hypothetical protein